MSIKNSVFGLAYGDAWGYVTEFLRFPQIKSKFPIPMPTPAKISDDTQMSLYSINAIVKAENVLSKLNNENTLSYAEWTEISQSFGEEYLIWLDDPRNSRAPGMNCLATLTILKQYPNYEGFEGSNIDSKGCGANMRNPWFGVLPYNASTVKYLSLIQSAITHSHPLALSSAVLTALTVQALYTGEVKPGQNETFYWVKEKINDLIEENLSDTLSDETGFYSWFPFIDLYSQGLQDLKEFWASREIFLQNVTDNVQENICSIIHAEGWIAEEALLLAVVATDIHANSPVDVIQRLAMTSGDSDSIAAIGGAMIGAVYTDDVWPENWYRKLELDYQQELDNAVIDINSLS